MTETKEPASENHNLEQQGDKVEFDVWYALRERQIPNGHYKEILKADFKGRGLKQLESVQTYDAALTKYGIKL